MHEFMNGWDLAGAGRGEAVATGLAPDQSGGTYEWVELAGGRGLRPMGVMGLIEVELARGQGGEPASPTPKWGGE